ncbi:YybH family protein [Saccharothrix sp. Mg75]|uniref:YybH family protein n=1 Tax=Saccharothrix sp. Mg75 TaxID=3445357 RepID=UPI003EEB51CF
MASEKHVLATDIDTHQEMFNVAFNAGDVEAVNALYFDDAVGLWEPGVPVAGQARRDYVANFIKTRNATVEATVLQQLVNGDTAMVVVEWEMDTTRDGKPEKLSGLAVDVLKRGEDGGWRYLIDNAYAGNGPWPSESSWPVPPKP